MTLGRYSILIAAAGMGALLGGCAAPTKPDQEQRVYFPQPPDPPRLQFLTSFSSGSGFASGDQKQASFTQWIAGDDPAALPRDRFDTPYGVDAYNGRLYVCDVGYNCVHIMDVGTRQYSLLGTPELLKNPVNITIDRSDGTKYVCDTARRLVLVFDANDSFVRELGDPKTLTPMDLVVGGDELFIADDLDKEIEVWSKDGKFLRTISHKGLGPDELDGPTNLAIGPDDHIYVSDTMAQEVKIFDKQGRYQSSIGRPGDRIGSFGRPKGIAIDPHGHIYVTDAQWQVMQVFTGNNLLLLVVSGMGGKAPGVIVPAAVAIDQSSLPAFQKYIAPDFEAEYLVFLVNQYGQNKVSVYAYGRSKSFSREAYEVKIKRYVIPETQPGK